MLRWLGTLASAVLAVAFGAGPAEAGLPPSLSWAPSTTAGSYDYATIDAGTTSTQTFTLRNSGGSATGAVKITLTGSSAFAITSNTCTGTSLGPKKSCTVTVRYAPTSDGQTDTATLTAISNKPAARASQTLTGASTAPVPPLNPQFQMLAQQPAGDNCENDVLVTGLAPWTEYTYTNYYTSGRTYTATLTTSSDGRTVFVATESVGESWTTQLSDVSGQLVGSPSQLFTSQC